METRNPPTNWTLARRCKGSFSSNPPAQAIRTRPGTSLLFWLGAAVLLGLVFEGNASDGAHFKVGISYNTNVFRNDDLVTIARKRFAAYTNVDVVPMPYDNSK